MARMPFIHSRRGVPMGGEDGQVLVMDDGRAEWAEPESLSGGQVGFVQGGKLIGANFNTTADQAIPIVSPTPTYIIFRHFVINPSTSLTLAQGSLYLGPGKSVLINGTTSSYSAAQVSTIDTLNNAAQVNPQNNVLTDNTTIYLSLTTAQGAPATADVYVYIIPIW